MASIKERNGHYTITVSLGYDIYGKKLSRSTTYTPDPKLSGKKLEKAVNDFAREYERKVLNNEIPSGEHTTLKELVDRWLVYQTTTGGLQPRTMEGYQQELNGKILPALGHKNLTELRPTVLTEFFLSLAKNGARKDGKKGGYSKASIRKTMNVLSSVLEYAIDLEFLAKNPIQNKSVRNIGEAPPKKCKFFTTEEARKFLQYLDLPQKYVIKGHSRTDDTGKDYVVGDHERFTVLPEQIRVLFLLAVYTGLGKGELLALEWDDIDFELSTITVSKACSYVNGQQVTKCPKSDAGNRKLMIPKFLSARILAMMNERQEYIKMLGDRWEGANWLFIQEDGKQMSYFTPNQTMTKIIDRYNTCHEDQLPHIGVHGLRHTHASIMIACNLDLRTMMDRMGHAQASTLLNTYTHGMPENDLRASNELEKVLAKQA